MNDLVKWGIGLFVTLGGASLIWKLLIKDAPAVVDLGLDELEKNPVIKAELIKYRPQIEALFDAVDAEFKAKLDKDAQ